jgi:hypothetical protein
VNVKPASFASAALRILPVLLTMVFAATFLAHVLPGRVIRNHGAADSGPTLPSEPWTDAQIVKPADFVKEMADAKNSTAVDGFEHMRVLMLLTSFAKDWAEQGYAYEKGK